MRVLTAAVITMSAAQLLDLASFMVMVGVAGPAAEANPLVSSLFASHGLPLVAIAKIALLALITGVAAVLIRPPARTRIVAVIIATGIVVGLVGGVSNTMAIGLI